MRSWRQTERTQSTSSADERHLLVPALGTAGPFLPHHSHRAPGQVGTDRKHRQYLQTLSVQKVHEAIVLIRQSGGRGRREQKEGSEGPWLAVLSFVGGKLQDRSQPVNERSTLTSSDGSLVMRKTVYLSKMLALLIR